MGTVVADGKASGQARIVTATVLQQPVMGQMVVGQPVVGGIPPSPYGGAYGDAYGGPYRGPGAAIGGQCFHEELVCFYFQRLPPALFTKRVQASLWQSQ
mmetsp:Transcript_160519/g.283095  ORF Transcript_160519/g.283095 Transcript_160519/m.283095 type:complete len:99 (-) Transcript_160519:24-320(-)